MTDAAETLANAVIGLMMSWAATHWFLGYDPAASAAITGMFFGLSFTRAFILRRIFRMLS